MKSQLLTRAKYSSSKTVEFANRWKFHARYQVSGQPLDTKYEFLAHQPLGLGTILDIGANYGQSALSISHYAPDHSILCVEANPILAPAMELARRRIPRCSYVLAAASDHTGFEELTIPTFGSVSNTGGASLESDFVRGRAEELEQQYRSTIDLRTRLVPTITIDSLAMKVAMIKIDVEGHELAVLRGASETISEHRPLIVMEVLHSSGDAMHALLDQGYSLFVPDGGDLIATSPESALAERAVDVVALPAERIDIT